MIVLPFPPSILAGHAKGNGHWGKIKATKLWREKAHDAAWDAGIAVPENGDIPLHIHFVPPDRRGDRVNFWNRCKPVIDGIADALQINDSRFLPSMSFAEPEKPGRVEVTLNPNNPQASTCPSPDGAVDGLPPEKTEAA